MRSLDEVVDHLGAGLRALADHDRGLGADLAGLRLAVAETAHVGNRRARGDHRVGGADFGAWRACGCELPVGSSASTMVSQNAIRNKKEHEPVPFPVRDPRGCSHFAAWHTQ